MAIFKESREAMRGGCLKPANREVGSTRYCKLVLLQGSRYVDSRPMHSNISFAVKDPQTSTTTLSEGDDAGTHRGTSCQYDDRNPTRIIQLDCGVSTQIFPSMFIAGNLCCVE